MLSIIDLRFILLVTAILTPLQTFAVDSESTTHHYYDGNTRVDLILSDHELRITTDSKRSLSPDGVLATNPLIQKATPVRGFENHFDISMTSTKGAQSVEEIAKTLLEEPSISSVNAVFYPPGFPKKSENQQVLTNRLSLQLKSGTDLAPLLDRYSLRVIEKVPYGENTYVLEVVEEGLLKSLEMANRIYENEAVEFCTPMIRRRLVKHFTPNDPLYLQQYYLNNSGQEPSSVVGNDLNTAPAWDSSTGSGVTIGIVDDGVQYTHPDLAAHTRTDIDIDVIGNDNDPVPQPLGVETHGTSVAGIAAAIGDNNTGMTGVAFDATLVGIRLITDLGTIDSEEAKALSHQSNPENSSDRIDILNNSWGPVDGMLRGPGSLTRMAVENAIQNGRGGLGSIFVWSGGNAGCEGDRTDFNGYANSRFGIAVASSQAGGEHSDYSEPGACILVNAPSDDQCSGVPRLYGLIATTHVGFGEVLGDYEKTFGGTSAAAPMVSGVLALILEANPNLTWRDVKHVLVETAAQISPDDTSWNTNGVGKPFSHLLGFGRVNAASAVALAPMWTNRPMENSVSSGTINSGMAIPDNNMTGISDSYTFNTKAGIEIEHVEVVVNISHAKRGDLRITLASPSGMESTFAAPHGYEGGNYDNWKFTSVAHWGEESNGEWTLSVSDERDMNSGTLNSWSITLHGASDATPPTETPTFTNTTLPTDTPTATATDTPAPPTSTHTPTSPPATETPTATSTGVMVVEVIQDGDFEDNESGNPNWTQTSQQGFDPIFSNSQQSHSGNYYALFGEIENAPDFATLEQSFNIPVGTAVLTYFLLVGNIGGSPTDELRVLIDGMEIASYSPADGNPQSDYVQETIDVTEFANGGMHTLRFEGTTNRVPGNSNWFAVDDVSLLVTIGAPTPTATATEPPPTSTPTLDLTPTMTSRPSVLDPRADVNMDGVVNDLDILIVLKNWMRINP